MWLEYKISMIAERIKFDHVHDRKLHSFNLRKVLLLKYADLYHFLQSGLILLLGFYCCVYRFKVFSIIRN